MSRTRLICFGESRYLDTAAAHLFMQAMQPEGFPETARSEPDPSTGQEIRKNAVVGVPAVVQETTGAAVTRG